MTAEYTSKDIQVLSDREHVRKRTQIYLGNMEPTTYDVPSFIGNKFNVHKITFIPSVFKAVGEIIDNSVDEFAQTSLTGKILSIKAQPLLGMYTVSDNGRGVPIDKHDSGVHTPQVVFGQLRSGRNFGDEKEAGVIGQNGVGSACVNFCSTTFEIDITRDKKRYRQEFSNGGENVSNPSVRKTSTAGTGTSISFQLDNDVFKDVSLPEEMMENRAIELALTNPGVAVQYNNKSFKFRNGFEDIIKKISTEYFKFSVPGMDMFVIFDVNKEIDEQIFTWVNSSLLFDGGICNTQFLNAFYDRTINHLAAPAKKAKSVVTKNDVRNKLLVIGVLRLSDPQYDAQSKTRLTGPNLRKVMIDMIDSQWSLFSRRNKLWIDEVLERAILRHHTTANKTAVKNHQKNLNKKVKGLIDATSKTRFNCQLLVTEGLSAASMITEARDPEVHGSYPLTGKINNVYGTTVAQLLKMGKVTDLITAIGLIPGQRAVRSNLNYGKLVIATDADVDGGDIFTLLVNLFYTFWPELFDENYEPFVYRLIAPNVCASKGNKRVHFATRAVYEKSGSRYSNWTISYYKGLGSMVQKDWEMILSGETDTLIPIVDDGKMKETLNLLFSKDADARKGWLQK